MEINIFVENTYEKYVIDEVKVYNNAMKIANYILSDKNILEKSCLNGLEFDNVSFDIVLMNNDDIHNVNRDYRKKDSPTDVITFAIFADSPEDEKFIFDGEVNLGEIMVSLDRIETQAQENNVTFESELYYIIAHGILHLLGFDHQTEPEFNFMVEVQNKAKAVVNV